MCRRHVLRVDVERWRWMWWWGLRWGRVAGERTCVISACEVVAAAAVRAAFDEEVGSLCGEETDTGPKCVFDSCSAERLAERW